MTPNARIVAVYCDEILPLSQTFVLSQADALPRSRPLFIGSRRVDGLDLADREVLTLRDRSDRFLLKGIRRAPGWFMRDLRGRNPALVHAHFGPSGYWAIPIARELDVPLVVTFHGFDVAVDPTASVAHFVYSRLRAKVFEYATIVIAVSHPIREKLIERGCPREKIVVHHIGVDVERFTRDPSSPREEIVLFVGRLLEKKGCHYLIEAMQRVQAARDVELIVIGDGPERRALEQLAQSRLTRFRFLGAQPPSIVREWMSRARVFSLPSVTAKSGDREGLPIVLLEAQSMGLPVVATRHSGIPEAVKEGETALLVPERDVESLATAIESLHGERGLAMGSAAARHVREQFDIRRQSSALEEIYDRALERHRS